MYNIRYLFKSCFCCEVYIVFYLNKKKNLTLPYKQMQEDGPFILVLRHLSASLVLYCTFCFLYMFHAATSGGLF